MSAAPPRLLALGGGGHLRVLLEALRLRGRAVEGILDADPALHGTLRFGLPVLGDDQVALARPAAEVRLINGLGGVGPGGARQRLFGWFSERGYRFGEVVHPAAVIAAEVALGQGVQIMAGTVLQPGVVLGDNCIVNTGATVDHDCQIGAHVHLAPGVTLSGGVTVGEGAHVGIGATVIQGVRIGAGALVAAGAVVVADVPAGVEVRGVPARERDR